MRHEGGITAEGGSGPDRVRIDRSNAIQTIRSAVDWDSLTVPPVAEPPQIVHAQDMVGMSVSQDEGIDRGYFIPDTLLAKLRSCVDLDMQAAHDHMHARATPLVSRIGRTTHLAGTGDHGDAL